MDGKRRAKWMLILAGAGLGFFAYVLGYGWCRQHHYLVHRSSFVGSDLFHVIDTGDVGMFPPWWWYTITHTVPYVVFSPLRWMETAWWELRDD